MSVREHLQLQLQVAGRVRWFLIVVLAAVLVWLYPEHSMSMFKRLWMFGAFLLYFWFLTAAVGMLLDLPMARPRCPNCGSKLTVGLQVIACASCGVGLDTKVQHDWRYTSITRALLPTHSPNLRGR
jgi:ribosomal protein L37E